ncbi:DUF397 domain-containing protein [Streptomyces sp. NPDC048290]|uniref:DUF397 domain-containing protein n=1 Tax=Streptomyces sp. NPDC048290 TaxID=3155811 RepID=UPI00343AF681
MTTETPLWFKSTYSEHGGQCIEIATNLAASDGVVPVRDSKNPAGPVLGFPVSSFALFVEGLKGGEVR